MFQKRPPLLAETPILKGGSFLLKNFGRLRRPNPKGGPFRNRPLRGLTQTPNLRPPKEGGVFFDRGVFFETYPLMPAMAAPSDHSDALWQKRKPE